MSVEWVQRHILHQTDEERDEIKKQIKKEKNKYPTPEGELDAGESEGKNPDNVGTGGNAIKGGKDTGSGESGNGGSDVGSI